MTCSSSMSKHDFAHTGAHTPIHTQEDIEDLTGAAVKEEQIETKLAALELDWAQINLVFAGAQVLEG